MFDVHSGKTVCCHGLDAELGRRGFLASLGHGVGTLGLASYLATTDVFGAARTHLHFPARAKHVIHLFMSGGPSQVDTFDPKPKIKQFEGQRPSEVELRTERTTGGLYPSPFKFRRGGESGISVSDLLPRIRDCIDDICVIRSMQTFSPNHEPAINFMASGRIDASHPTLGAWVSYGLGPENDDLPGFVALGGVDNRLVRNGYLPGLFEETLLVWGGEFGRTPVSESQDGRDHNSYGFTMWLAGGGVRGGMVYGTTDDFGFRAVRNRVSVHDLHATILYLLGVNHEKLTYRYSGRDFRLTDVHGRVLREIVA